MKNWWWKILGAVLLVYVCIFGLVGEVPRQPILNETIRNVYFHVPMWFAMMVLMTISMLRSIQYLRSNNVDFDHQAIAFAGTAFFFGLIGFATGAIWGNFTWGSPLPLDPKLIAVEVGLLLYAAYFVLRGSFEDEQKKARLSAVYNIFAFAAFMPLVWILPRLTDSLHPGNGGNPAFGKYDMDSQMRMVFYPACVAWILIGIWIGSLKARLVKLEYLKKEI
ncbi:cytochrome c biogenesis protein [Marinilongibacter aquaticus]|uniref:cytochrome c biogenesis protein n=1 Tax=Marinilongibacter aquaticus TaxID=2975157 RepID=UPI0021BDED6D|nr:cytochrome c biogenesis protein [Marinilongibacter aquaticus]UBM60996.1 cytochrome c biogenesis protein [Marinilongibacter aquaticus]